MGDVSQYLNWLRHHQCRPGIVNSYLFVELISRVNALLRKEKMSACPHVLIEKEFEDEEKSQGESPILRKFLMQILGIALKEEISQDCYDTKLILLLNRPGVLPGGIENPLSLGKKVHQLSTEIKLYVYNIICRSINENFPTTNPIGSDSVGNLFYIADGGRLYVEYGEQLRRLTQERKLRDPLERNLAMKKWKLIAETDKKWKSTALIMQTFEQEKIAVNILETMDKISIDNMNFQSEGSSEFFEKLAQLRIKYSPKKDRARKCPNDSFCSNEKCTNNHYEQYHPITTKYEHEHMGYARKREEDRFLDNLPILNKWNGKC